MKNFDILAKDLSFSRNNSYNKSGLGGNASQLFWFLTNNVSVEQSANQDFDVVERLCSSSPFGKMETILIFPENIDWKKVRIKLDFFLKEKVNVDITFDHLIDLDFLQSCDNMDSISVEALKISKDMLPEILSKTELAKKVEENHQPEIDAVFSLAKEKLKRTYHSENGLPTVLLTYSKIRTFIDSCEYHKQLENVILNKIDQEIELLFSQQELENIKFIAASKLNFVILRLIFNVDSIWHLNLNKYFDFEG